MENDNKNPLEPYRTPYLFLLIGTNPLPNYVAAQLLWAREKQNAKLYFVYTADTEKYVTTLKTELGLEVCEELILIDVKDESNTKKIFDGVYEEVQKLKNEGVDDDKIGLNYTGGTKTMAVHAYRGIRELSKGAHKSYLDARSLEMVIEREGEEDKREPTRDLLEMSIDTFLALHSFEYKIEKGKQIKPRNVDELLYPNLAKAIGESNLIEDIHDWSQNQYRRIKFDPQITKKKDRYEALELPLCDKLQEHYNGCTTIGEFTILQGWDPEKTCLYFDGDWLEEYVLMALNEINEKPNKYSCGIDVKPQPINGVDFQIDDFAINGYQLFAVSCGTGKKRGDLKTKLFEALIRARQIGGDEARVALVCGIEDSLCLENELIESWNLPKGLVRVFGKNEIPSLSTELNCWINYQ